MLQLFLNSRSRRNASSEPVQAPEPGKGMETNTAKPRYPYFSTTFFLFSTLFSIFRNRSPIIHSLEMKFLSFFRRKRIRGTGRMFASVHMRNASQGEIPKAIARGIPPRSSMNGEEETSRGSK